MQFRNPFRRREPIAFSVIVRRVAPIVEPDLNPAFVVLTVDARAGLSGPTISESAIIEWEVTKGGSCPKISVSQGCRPIEFPSEDPPEGKVYATRVRKPRNQTEAIALAAAHIGAVLANRIKRGSP